MESTNLTPCPLTEHYEQDQLPELVFKENGAHYRHCHSNSEAVYDLFFCASNCDHDLVNIYEIIEKVISIYAHVKHDIDNLKTLLEDDSIKIKTRLHLDLTMALSDDQQLESTISPFFKLASNHIINEMYDHRSQLLEDLSQVVNPPTRTCQFKEEYHQGSIRFECLHSHPPTFPFKTYKELLHRTSLIKADLAYFNNIENSQEWATYHTQSIEIGKLFKFNVEIAKVKDEIYLQLIETIEPIAKSLLFQTFQQKHKCPLPPIDSSQWYSVKSEPFLVRPRPLNLLTIKLIIDDLRIKTENEIFITISKTLCKVVPLHKYFKDCKEIYDLSHNKDMAFDKLSTLIDKLTKEKGADLNLLKALRSFIYQRLLGIPEDSELPEHPLLLQTMDTSSSPSSNQPESGQTNVRIQTQTTDNQSLDNTSTAHLTNMTTHQTTPTSRSSYNPHATPSSKERTGKRKSRSTNTGTNRKRRTTTPRNKNTSHTSTLPTPMIPITDGSIQSTSHNTSMPNVTNQTLEN